MKNSYKVALLAVLGLASVPAARAYTSGDLLVGVYQPGEANTEVLDLGSFSSVTTGSPINLSSALAAAGYGATLSSSAYFGVFGGITAGNAVAPHTVYETTGGPAVNAIPDDSTFNGIKTGILTLANNAGPQTANQGNGGVDFASQMTIGNGGLADDLGYDPASLVTGSAALYSVLDDGSAPVLDGSFSLNPNTEILTFTPVAVPEPTTYGLVAAAGLLVVSLRNKLSRKQA